MDFESLNLSMLTLLFSTRVKPPMPSCRKALVIQAFKKLDKTCDGSVTVEDLKGIYNVKRHPMYISGEWNEERCLLEFLVSFDTPNEADGIVCDK